MEIVDFEPEHLARLRVQREQMLDIGAVLDDAEALRVASVAAWSGIEGDRVLGCIGIFLTWRDRMVAWGLLGKMGPVNFLHVHRRVRNFLDGQAAPIRIEATVYHDHAQGHRWMQQLGFVLETPNGMKGYARDGGTCDLYAFVKGPPDDGN